MHHLAHSMLSASAPRHRSCPFPCPSSPPSHHPLPPPVIPLPLRPSASLSLCPSAGRKFERSMTPGLILKVSNIGAAATQDTIGLFLNAVGVPKAAADAAGGAGEGASSSGAGAGEVDEGGHLRFVDYEEGSGANVAHCRFASPAAAAAAAAAVNAGSDEAKKATGSDKPAAEVLT